MYMIITQYCITQRGGKPDKTDVHLFLFKNHVGIIVENDLF